jgi:phage-related protein
MGFRGGGVLVVIEGFDGITLRTMYTVRSEDAEYVLHAFQKKSTQATVEGAMQGSL